jgi:chain length determinant protein EpsF
VLSFKQFLAILRGRRREIMLIWAGLFGLVVAGSLSLPKQYTASAAIVIDVKAPELLNTPNALSVMTVPSYIATQVDVLRSERVALWAVRHLGLDRDVELRERWLKATEGKGDFESWLAARLHRKLDIKPSRESNAIYLDYTAKDPKEAASVVNAIVRGYIETTVELRIEPTRQFASFFDERSKRLREELEAAQLRLSDFQRETGILARDERLDVETARLNDLNAQLVALQSLAAESAGRRAQAAADPSRTLEVLNNPVVTSLSADLNRQQAHLQELTSRLGDQHPQVIEALASIAELRRRLTAATAQVSGGVAANDAVNRARVAQLESALAAQRAKVLALKEKRDEIEVLVRDVESAQKAYELVLVRGSQTNLESQNTQANVSILKNATEPASPSSPLIVLNAGIALVVGLIAAICHALVREHLDRRLRTVEDVVHDLRIVMLAELVDTSTRGQARMPSLPLLSGPSQA